MENEVNWGDMPLKEFLDKARELYPKLIQAIRNFTPPEKGNGLSKDQLVVLKGLQEIEMAKLKSPSGLLLDLIYDDFKIKKDTDFSVKSLFGRSNVTPSTLFNKTILGKDNREDVKVESSGELSAPARYVGILVAADMLEKEGGNVKWKSRTKLSDREFLCPNNIKACFHDQYAINDATSTGILLETQDGTGDKKYYILLAGHAVPEDISEYRFVLQYLENEDTPWDHVLGGLQVSFLSHAPDFALLEVNINPGLGLSGHVLNGNCPPGPPPFEQEIDAYFHPNGLSLKSAKSVAFTRTPFKNPDKLTDYFFASIDASQGCSGGPAFMGDTLLGIVKAAGNTGHDFSGTTLFGGCRVWRRVNEQSFAGTQVTSMNGVFQKLKNDTDLKKLFPQSWFNHACSPAPASHGMNLNLTDHPLWVQGQYLVYDNGDSIQLHHLKESQVVEFEGENYRISSGALGTKLNNKFPEDPNLPPRIRTCTWSKKHLKDNDGFGLHFTYPVTFKNNSPLPAGQQVAALEGIGSMDIIDELPNNSPKLQQVWLADGNYVELSLDTYGDIKIRTLDGLVDIYRRQF